MTRKDNSFNNARKIGALSNLKVIRDSVGPGDNADFVSFRVTGRSSFRSVLRGLGRNVDLVLFDKDRNRLTASRNPGRQSELVDTILDRGRYFLKVQRKGGKSNYRLRLSSSPVNAPDPTTAEYVGLTDTNTLAFFNDENLSNVTQVSVTGLQSGESLIGVDFRPNTGELFGVGSTNRLYTIDAATGAATQVGTDPFAIDLNGTSFGVDFNPTVDRIRIVSNTGQNLRLNPDTGAVVDADTVTGGLQIDGAINGATDSLVATAYANNFSGTTATTQYTIDASTDQLFIQNPPNNGTQNLVGSLGIDFGPNVGFDIVTQNGINTGYATSGSSLYSIDLNTGTATLIGNVQDKRTPLNLSGLAARTQIVKPDPTTAEYVGLSANNSLVFFNSNGANFNGLNNVTQVDITGLQSGESLVGIDFRPTTGDLFGVGSSNRLYSINASTGVATQVGDPFAVLLNGTNFGIDFNPVVDRIRVVSNTGQNLRLNPDTGAVVDADPLTGGVQTDGVLNGATNSIVATAYSNSFGGATTTVQYGINTDTDQLFIQNPPNDGTQTLVGSLGVDFDASAGFNIVTSNGINTAYASSGSSLYSIDLNTGAASFLGNVRDINQSIALTGLASRV